MKASKTEQRNPRTRGLDKKSSIEIVRAMNREDKRVALAVGRAVPQIARAVDRIVKGFESGGRLIYVGAGTSGRLAVLDASECPPTFGTPPRMVQGLIAGGGRALRNAVEGAEDSAANGARDLQHIGLKSNDVVVGIAASGTTPYVLGALRFARQRKATAVGITSNGGSALARQVEIAIVVKTGPEIVAGSTRLKAGTAQKLVLNMLSTAAMARIGRVYENWMVAVALTNKKLMRRGARILQEAAGVAPSVAAHALRTAGHDMPTALVMLKAGVRVGDAKKRLTSARGNVRKALEMRTERVAAGAGRRRKNWK